MGGSRRFEGVGEVDMSVDRGREGRRIDIVGEKDTENVG